jgi:thiol-disulfide isomerase/thioredoxin
MRKHSAITIAVLVSLAVAGCKREEPAPSTPQTLPSKLGDAAWPLDGLQFVKGGPVRIEPGKVFVVEFWATWCPPCRTTIPHLTDLARRFEDDEVIVVGISRETVDIVKTFVEKMGNKMDYHVAVDPEGKVSRGYSQAFDRGTIPHAFVVDAAGRVVWYGHPMDNLEQVLAQVLAGTFDPAALAAREARMREVQGYFAAVNGGASLADARAALADCINAAEPELLDYLSWNIMTELPEPRRDIALALETAEKANALTEGNDATVLDTYALALFQNGKVQEAIATQAKAVELAEGNEPMQAELQRRLDQYTAAQN